VEVEKQELEEQHLVLLEKTLLSEVRILGPTLTDSVKCSSTVCQFLMLVNKDSRQEIMLWHE
jgi:hypothetical protein